MNKIKFSHRYYKLSYGEYQIKFAELLQVFKCHLYDLSEIFIKQDTLYWEKGASFQEAKYYQFHNYELNEPELIVLIFRDIDSNRLFTTIRRRPMMQNAKWISQKYEYYKSKVGEIFEVEIKED